MVSNDPRQIVEQRVHKKALYVTLLAECARQYGSRLKSNDVAGTVLECIARKKKTS